MDTEGHNPDNLCNCEPGSIDACEYRMLADAVVEHLGPRDGDEAEVALCITAVERAGKFIASLPCTCKPGYDDDPCGRCSVLGQWHGEGTGG